MTIKKFISRLAMAGVFVAAPVIADAEQGLLDTFPLTLETTQQWKLPGRLKEISGLALTADGRLFALNDEIAVIYELDYVNGSVLKAFAFGNPVVRADFEGIAWLDGKIWLTTSSGVLYSGNEGADGEQVPHRKQKTGLGKQCEIEGLTASAALHSLFLVCKRVKKKADVDGLKVFSWSIDDARLDEGSTFVLPRRKIRTRLGTDKFNPSGIALAPQNGNFLILASRQRALVETTPQGTLVSARTLPLASRHRQPEGIEITADARLLIADEGGSRKARLAVYWQEGAQRQND
jgi:uncharacterized protein YjiK